MKYRLFLKWCVFFIIFQVSMLFSQNAMVAEVGDIFPVYLKGRGWIYTGAAGGSVEFLEKIETDTNTFFSFRALEAGELTLQFSYQNTYEGTFDSKDLVIVVMTPQNETPLVESVGTANVTESVVIDKIEDHEGSESVEEPVDSQTLFLEAQSLLKNEMVPEAKEAFRALLEDAEYGVPSAGYLIAMALEKKDGAELVALHQYRSSVPDELSEEYLYQTSKALVDAAMFEEALTMQEEFINSYGDSVYLVDVLFNNAYILENSAEHRNIKKAYDYYSRIVNHYPLSSYWEDAKNKTLYLERHYFFAR